MATSTPGGDGASDTKRGMTTSTPGGTSDTKRSIATSTPGGDEGASDTKRSRLAALHRKHAAAVAATTTPSPSKQPPPSSSSPASFRIFKTDPNDLNYAKLCPSVFNGPLVSQLQLRKDDSNVAVDKVLRELLASNAKMSGKIGGTIETRVQDRVLLLDNPATQGGAVDRAKNKAHRSRSKRSSKHLSLRQHRHLGSFNLPIEYQKYELYLPMHEMWKEYARKLVHNCNDAMMQTRLLTADLHGAMIAVVESKSTSYVGTNGIMVRETENTFGIMTIKDKLRGMVLDKSVYGSLICCIPSSFHERKRGFNCGLKILAILNAWLLIHRLCCDGILSITCIMCSGAKGRDSVHVTVGHPTCHPLWQQSFLKGTPSFKTAADKANNRTLRYA